MTAFFGTRNVDNVVNISEHMYGSCMELMRTLVRWGPKLYLRLAPHRNDDRWASKAWDQYGINALHTTVKVMKATQLSDAPGSAPPSRSDQR